MSNHPGYAECVNCGGSIFRENATTNRWYHLDSGVGSIPFGCVAVPKTSS